MRSAAARHRLFVASLLLPLPLLVPSPASAKPPVWILD